MEADYGCRIIIVVGYHLHNCNYEGWNLNSGNYLFTTDTKQIHVSKFYCPSM